VQFAAKTFFSTQQILFLCYNIKPLVMIKKTCLLLTLFSIYATSLVSQNPGCDGNRYKSDVFQTVKKTTVVYAPTIGHTGGAINLSMDVYEPEGDVITSRPVVILAHGGSFIFGDRSMMEASCQLLAKKGYIAATISYRLYPFLVLGFPDSTDVFDTAVKAVGDMRAAVRYFREDAATTNLFHADADHIFIGGYSAGAVTALHSAYLDAADDIPAFLQTLIVNNGGLDGISGTNSNKTFNSNSKAVVNLSGGLYRRDWIDTTEVPIVSIHGTADETVPFVSGLAAGIAYLEGSSLLHARSDLINLRNSLHVVPGAGHTNLYDSPTYKADVDTFWVKATTLLESLTCTTVGTPAASFWEADWSVSPNPNYGNQFALRLPVNAYKVDLKIIDMKGALVFQRKDVVDQAVILTPMLAKGVYMVQLTEPELPGKQFVAKKLVIE